MKAEVKISQPYVSVFILRDFAHFDFDWDQLSK